MSQPEAMYQLQEIDLGILRDRKRLREIADILANDESLRAAQAGLDAAQNRLSPLRTRSRDLDLEIQSNEAKTRSSEQQLYSGNIKNPKEMQDVQQEIESLKKRHSDLENMLLETMMAVEEAEAALAEAQTNFDTVAASRGDEHRQLLDEKARLEARVRDLQARRAISQDDIRPENLQLYETMRPRKHNQPIAIMQGNTCSFCGVAQTMAIEREVRQAKSLVRCSNCDRILVYRQ
jgi:predicted  nucleic acid-binding Zn-ribbon protein